MLYPEIFWVNQINIFQNKFSIQKSQAEFTIKSQLVHFGLDLWKMHTP